MENQSPSDALQFSRADQIILNQVATELSGNDAFINSIIFVNLTGQVHISSNIGQGMFALYQYYQEHDVLAEPWIDLAKQANGLEVFLPHGIGGEINQNEVSIVKQLNNTATREPFGYLVINLSRRVLNRSFTTVNEAHDTSRYFLLSDKAKPHPLFFRTGEWDEENGEEETVLAAFLEGDSQVYLFSAERNLRTGWMLVSVIEQRELNAVSAAIRNWVFALSLLMIVLCAFIAKVLSKNVTKPLQKLKYAIQQVGEGKRHIEEEFDASEIGVLGNEFKNMVNHNLKLSERLLNAEINEREAEILLLQSQINPHFLYNTLDSVYCMAIIHGDDQIADMVLALSNHFKLSLNQGEKYITVMDSIQRIEEYMKLQNMRFNNRFIFTIDIKPEMMKEQIVNFILQPFVENALIHGLEPKIGAGKLTVLGYFEQQKMVFEVIDNGVGMNRETKLNDGYGIYNVKERIRLIYGEAYGVKIVSEQNGGTKVTIKIPRIHRLKEE